MRKLIIFLSVIFYTASIVIALSAFSLQYDYKLVDVSFIVNKWAALAPESDMNSSSEEGITSTSIIIEDESSPELQPEIIEQDSKSLVSALDEELSLQTQTGDANPKEIVDQNEVDAGNENNVIDAKSESIPLTVLGEGIFLPGQGKILEEYSQEVLFLVPAVKQAIPEYYVLIEGYTDNIPIGKSSADGIQSNKDLSYQRAKAAASILQQGGIPGEYIIVRGYGEANPIASNLTVEGRAKNRRIEISLVPAVTVEPDKG